VLLLALQSFKTIMTPQYLNAFDSGVAAGDTKFQNYYDVTIFKRSQ